MMPNPGVGADADADADTDADAADIFKHINSIKMAG